jgi:hypothetical protein
LHLLTASPNLPHPCGSWLLAPATHSLQSFNKNPVSNGLICSTGINLVNKILIGTPPASCKTPALTGYGKQVEPPALSALTLPKSCEWHGHARAKQMTRNARPRAGCNKACNCIVVLI